MPLTYITKEYSSEWKPGDEPIMDDIIEYALNYKI